MGLLKKGTLFAFACSAVSVVTWIGGDARAQDAELRPASEMAGVTFEEADLDDSGAIDATEAKELGLDVVRYDTNYNGVIDKTEWERAPEQATEPSGEKR